MARRIKTVGKKLDTDIALVISKLDCGGAQRVLVTLANYWVTKGKKITLITFADRNRDFFSVNPFVRRIVIGDTGKSQTVLQGLIANIQRAISLRKAMRNANAKVIIGFLSRTNILVILGAFGLGSRVAISERNDPARQSIGWPWDLLRRLIYRYADVVTANSRGALQTMSAYVPEDKLAFVPNPLDPSPKIANRKKTFPFILSVGSLTHQKGHDVLLKAFSGLAPRFPEWRLQIVGEGNLRGTLLTLSRKLGISDRVMWPGRVKNPFSYYDAADVFVLVSRYEGMPNALLEAMSFGLPVVVSDASSGPLEFVEHEVSGLVVPVENAKALESVLELLINDPELRHRLGETARRRVAECNLSNVIKVWEKVIGLGSNNRC